MHSEIRLDSAVSNIQEDRYGYHAIAHNLARSILSLDGAETAVIGIEGAWGTGKTSLLNLLLLELNELVPEKTYIINFSPWLSGHESSLVESLLIPVAGKIEYEEEKRLSSTDLELSKKKKEISQATSSLLHYAQQTSRRLSPLVEFSGNFIPGMSVAGKGMKIFSEIDLVGKKNTAAELRLKTEQKISELGIKFIVVLDDLDRLEPRQAIEIIRLIKSVANFSNFKYVICYDKKVLAHAVELGLGVADGALYLQKIVQLSFKLPRHESFDLRREFCSQASALYKSVNNETISNSDSSELNRITDIYGASFATPREVRLAINSISFLYPGMRDFVYFPDLCFLHLIKTLNPGLYDWIEHYLTERSIINSGDGSIDDNEQGEMINQLKEHLKNYRTSDARSPNELGHYIPGIQGDLDSDIRIFNSTKDSDRQRWTELKKISSDAFYRFYFSFSAPQNVLPPDYFDMLMRQAASDRNSLQSEMIGRIDGNGISSLTWFEHILGRFTKHFISEMSYVECEGMLWFFFNCADDIKELFLQRNRYFSLRDIPIDIVVNDLIRKMRSHDIETSLQFMKVQFREGRAIYWITQYMRSLLWSQGLAGDRIEAEDKWLFTLDELENLKHIVAYRINSEDVKSGLLSRNTILGHLYAWKEISSDAEVQDWVSDCIHNEEILLALLLKMRTVIYSNEIYQVLYIDKVSDFFVGIDIIKRINELSKDENFQSDTVKIKEAIDLARNF